mmetsp:Transcript_4445/g.12822  ORF Transcript_4445/g.12822 Transcript_4445/m.12822 type:complete len:1392 (+) Transcript_4445:134-4309(+)
MVRRSSRPRQKVTSTYDAELEALAAKKHSQDSDSETSEIEKEVKEAMAQDDDTSDFSEGEDFKAPAKVSPPKKTERTRRQVSVRGGNKKAKKGASAGKTKSKASAKNALKALAKKVLDPKETPNDSLVSALLSSAGPISGVESASAKGSRKATIYTPQLVAIARRLLQDHDPNSMHIQLMNLLFRSVGGNLQTNFKEGTDLEEIDDEEWDDVVTRVVDVMRESDTALLTAVPDDKLGTREYRAIYEEFWYRLGVVILSHTSGTGGEDDNENEASKKFTSNRFQVELMRDLVSRVTELVLVGQPDLRAAASSAIWELAKACTERTVELTAKLETAQRQHAASKGQKRKMQALQLSMDSWKRHKAELEAVVEESIIQGVFIRRYRDSNPFIRRQSLEALTQLALDRPDLFLKDKFLKYLGWMASDKDSGVRVAALKGLLAPFKYKQDKRPTALQIDVQAMQNVCSKFLRRIADCTDDVSLDVQEVAMELILKLTNEGFLDDWDDDAGWERLNLKALDANSTPGVRKNALYIILDQLDVFDEGGDGRSVASVITLSERQQMTRIDEISKWVAAQLAGGPVSNENIKLPLVDFIVQSFRDMPEHRNLTTCWPAMLKAIRSESNRKGEEKEEAAKTQILLRYLACAADLEIGHGDEVNGKKRKRSANPKKEEKHTLSEALLKSLPGLLESFKTDHMSMRSLCKIPSFLSPEVFSLPSRKSEFSTLIKNLCLAYLESTDEEVLAAIAASLSVFVQGDHARVADVKAQLKRVATNLQDRLMELFAESDPDSASVSKSKGSKRRKSNRRSDASMGSQSASETIFSNSREVDIEHSICLCLQRMKILMKEVPLSLLFDEDRDDDDENEVEGFFKTLSEALGKRLLDRKPRLDDEDDADTTRTPSIAEAWKADDPEIHSEVAKAVDIGLDVLLCIVAWNLRDTYQEHIENTEFGTMDTDVDSSDLPVVRLRDGLANLIGLCYEQYLEDVPGLVYSDEQVEFASTVQTSAGRVASDLRTLFPREWSKAKDLALRALALTNDHHLIAGFVRYLNSRKDEFEANDPDEDFLRARDLLLPIARSLAANWADGNRKEAGIVLSHLTGKGKLAGQTVHLMAKKLKKINPVRFLESQMAALRMAFQQWIDGEPEEIPEHPSEDQMEAFEEAEKSHQALFLSAEHLASRLSMSLGVSKLTDSRLSQALLNFMQEGIRFAFEGDTSGVDDLVLGSRLPFLLLLTKYSNWIKKEKGHRRTLAAVLLEKEASLRAHPDFVEVHEDDYRCIRTFQEAFGIAAPKRRQSQHSRDDSSSIGHHSNHSATETPASGAPSTGSRRPHSAAGSQRSARMSIQSNLSPLRESPEDREDSVDSGSPSPQKRRRLASSLPEVHEDPVADDGESDQSSTFSD